MKNKISSIGKLNSFKPVRYFSVKPQTLISVKNISQTIKGIATIRTANIASF